MKTRSRPGWIGRCGADPDEPATRTTYPPSGKRIRDGTAYRLFHARSARRLLPCVVLAFCIGTVIAQEAHANHDNRVHVSVDGEGTTSVTGQSGLCGANCYIVPSGNTLTVTAKGKAGTITRFSGACSGNHCQFTPTRNAVVNVTFVSFNAIMAIFDDAPPQLPNEIFNDGFEAGP